MEQINKKYLELCEEIKWRYGKSDYKESDKLQVVVHESIDKDVSFISIADVENLCNELGIKQILEIEQKYIGEFGEFPKEKEGIEKLRVLLYWYFENRFFNDKKMRTFFKLD